MQLCYSFFAIVRQSVIDRKQIRIPEDLVKKYKDEISDIVKLSLPSGGEWAVHFNKSRKMACFDDGLESFMEDNSIGLNYLLLFKYAKNSRFNVHIFDLTATEIDYPWNSGDGEDCGTGDDGNDLSIFGPDMKRRRTSSPKGQTIYRTYELRSKLGKLKKNVTLDGNEPRDPVGECDQDNAYEESTGDLHNRLDGSCDGNKHKVSKREEIAEGKLVLQNPHDTVRLTQYQVLGISMYVTASFARRLLPGNPRSINLEDEDGNRWRVKCKLRARRVCNLALGWRVFTQDKKLEAGNVCVFESVKDSPAHNPVLKVYIFPSWEDLPQIASH